MAAITQLRSSNPFVGGRYGSFSGKDVPAVPAFMRGTLDVFPSLTGDIQTRVLLVGDIHAEPSLRGRIEVNP